jgi:small conductance mechanosensitive channel
MALVVDIGLLTKLVVVAGIIIVTALVFEGGSRLLPALARRAGARGVTIHWIRDGFRILWIAIGAYAVLTYTGIAFEFTLTISGIAGLALSLALQTPLSNRVSGILRLHDGAMGMGDVIECAGLKGKVLRVALRNTWVLTHTGPVAMINNGTLPAGPLINYTAALRFATGFGS